MPSTLKAFIFLPRYDFCSDSTVKEDVLLTLMPC